MSDPPLHIVVDDREARTSRVMEFLEAEAGTRITRKRLSIGDYLVEGRILVERKRIPDFLISLCDGRLFRQASALAGCGMRGIVILEGHGDEWKDSGVRREATQGALLTLGIVFDLMVLRALDEKETAQLILFTAHQMRQNAQAALRRPGWRPKGKRARQIYILSGLPGVGPKRAQRLLERFNSIEGVLAATEAELTSVPGLGAKVARGIREILRSGNP